MTSISITVSIDEDKYTYLREMMIKDNLNRSQAISRIIQHSKAYQAMLDLDEEEEIALRSSKKGSK